MRLSGVQKCDLWKKDENTGFGTFAIRGTSSQVEKCDELFKALVNKEDFAELDEAENISGAKEKPQEIVEREVTTSHCIPSHVLQSIKAKAPMTPAPLSGCGPMPCGGLDGLNADSPVYLERRTMTTVRSGSSCKRSPLTRFQTSSTPGRATKTRMASHAGRTRRLGKSFRMWSKRSSTKEHARGHVHAPGHVQVRHQPGLDLVRHGCRHHRQRCRHRCTSCSSPVGFHGRPRRQPHLSRNEMLR